MSTNLSEKRRNKMLETLANLRTALQDNPETCNMLMEIENELNKKKYGLIWEEHEEHVDEELKTKIPVFKEVQKLEIKKDIHKPINFLLEGDNLHSLYLLEKTHRGKIDIIYIDPPYNTGNEDFIYNDKIIDNEDGYKHSKWLSFMQKRLFLARTLLTEQGMIFISIDDNEIAQLKILCDEIFGEENRISTHHVQVRYAEKSLADGKPVKPVMEYVLIYAKNSFKCELNLPKEEYTDENFVFEIQEKSKGKIIEYKDGTKVEVFLPNEWQIEKKETSNIQLLKETWVSGTIYSKMSYGQVVRKYIEPRYEIDGCGCLYKVIGRGDDGLGYRYYVGPSRKNSTRCKMYSGMPLTRVEEITSGKGAYRNVPISNFMDYAPDFGNIVHEGGVPFNSGKKPVKMLKQLIKYHKNKAAIILDFFAGSGSTAQAVLESNLEDGGNRQFILCTNNENNICKDITYKRICNVINGYGKNNPQNTNLKYYKTEYINRFNKESENYYIVNELSSYIKELVQLEQGIDITNPKVQLIFDDENADKILFNEELVKKCKIIYLDRNVMLTSEQQDIILENKISIIEIPEYYFENEIMEVEGW